MNFPASRPCFKGLHQESSHEPGSSDAVRELSREPAMFQIGNCSRTVSEYCSARVSRVGLSTKQATEPYSDNPVNRTRNPSEPYSDKEIALRRALRRFAFLVGFSIIGNPPKTGTFTAWNRTRNRTRTPSDVGRRADLCH